MPICVLANVGWAGNGWTRMEGKLLILLCLIYFFGLGWTWLEATGRVLGGEGGIRTPDTLTSMPDFESGAFNRALPPLRFVFNSMAQELRRAAIGTPAMTHRLRAVCLVADFQVKFTSPAGFTQGSNQYRVSSKSPPLIFEHNRSPGFLPAANFWNRRAFSTGCWRV